ncbi:hypothetical protein O181_014091 [Austropuccinia psidii MF-1]|uniref:Integrase zinc-binding domain-containing protein n=1 Tax=Austropuccinia psidii MF-1 TaxID=1389203 RepID=A0A9Q3BXI9_9BASI|nr:hypothetical protein [Austropuccinia psidii MF-1]
MSELPKKIPLIIFDFSESPSLFVTHHTRNMVELPSFPSFECEFLVNDTPKGEDLILGFDFLNNFNPSIDWRQGLIAFNADHKDYYDLSNSCSNDFSSAKSCAALVGDSRSPSFPSSIHIPSLDSHQSLLSSRDEVFKEIQDFQEDNSVSSLHLFFGNMGLPPSSYHESLEELWDEGEEPEEVETVIKELLKENQLTHQLAQGRFLLSPQLGALRKHPIAFNSRKLIAAELNYEINDKELLGIVWAFLLSLSSPFEVLTNHSPLQYFLSSKVLTCCQSHWAELLSEYHFSITYCPGRLASLSDALSHWDSVYPERGEDFISKNTMNFQQLIKQDEVQHSRYFTIKVESFSNLIDSIQKALWQDSQYRSILQDLGKDWVVVPNDPKVQLNILQKHHDSPLAGHPGQEKTLKLVKRDFHWSSMIQFIKDYVSSCQQCTRNKNIHHKKFVLIKPLSIPNGPWIFLSMDFITQLPLSNSFDSILVIVDRFSKMAVFIPTMSSITSLDLANFFINNIFSKNCLPWRITERVNKRPKQYLWMYVSYHQDDWNTSLPLAKFAYNNSDHSSTKQSPSFTFYGRDPQFDSVNITQDTHAGKLSTKMQSVWQEFKRELEVAINRLKRYADKSRESPPAFNPGEMVWLSSKNIASTRPTKKLSERWLGPFPILKKVITNAYHCKLPSQWKSFHPVFHISLLEPVKKSTIPNGHQEPPSPIIIEEEEKWEPNVKRRPNQPHFICQPPYQSQNSFQDSMPLEYLHPIHLNSLRRLLPYLGAQEFTIQGKGVLSQPQIITPLNGCCSNSNLNPSYGQLAI